MSTLSDLYFDVESVNLSCILLKAKGGQLKKNIIHVLPVLCMILVLSYILVFSMFVLKLMKFQPNSPGCIFSHCKSPIITYSMSMFSHLLLITVHSLVFDSMNYCLVVPSPSVHCSLFTVRNLIDI